MTDNNASIRSRPRQESPDSTLRRARLAKGLSQVDLADVSGVSVSWISVLERRPPLMSRRVAERLAGPLGIPVEELRS
jgi:transcriptional regulator with XRE-family HTH domain